MVQTASSTGINLLPQEEISQKPVNKFVVWALGIGRYIVIFTEAIVLIVFLARFKLDAEILDLKQQMQAKAQLIESLQDFEEEFRLTQTKIKTVESLLSQKSDNAQFLGILEEKTPVDIILTSLSNREGTVELVGLAEQYASVTQLVEELKKEDQLFSKVVLASLGRVKEKGSEENEELGKIHFTIQASLGQTTESTGTISKGASIP